MPQLVPAHEARRLVRDAVHVALAINMGNLRQDLVDVGKDMACQAVSGMARRFKTIPLAELFGTLVIGGMA
jgi:hypothetical protein